MLLLQLSSGQGPEECSRAVALAFERMLTEARQYNVDLRILERQDGRRPGCYKSLLIGVKGADALPFSRRWQGSFLWVCSSPYRPAHKRKNWYFSGELFDAERDTSHEASDESIEYRSCRVSGAGGQHVNTTDSAVQA
ncbi:peptide chain release factor H, partial [Oceanospirillum sp. HFRX-1_2]